MKVMTPTELRSDIYRVLDGVLESGTPIEIDRKGQRLRIVPVEPIDKFKKLIERPDFIKGDPDDLIHIDWEMEVNLDLP